ncbi:MAG TPA: sigma-70 family RNA polymerase sigma factor [Acidimicrobiia bacterium]|nr:sigma-70 family RNA polymerase sigma factor [Acidimicrobiia bacterium]
MAGAGAAAKPSDDMRALVAALQPDALRLARHLLGSGSEAEDLAQTAVLRVLARADAITDASTARAYLFTTVRNLWRNQLRARDRRRILQETAAGRSGTLHPGPEDEAVSVLERETARAAFDALPASSQEVIWLRYVDRLDYAALGARLGVSAAAARQRVHRARDQLVAACIDADATGGTGPCREARGRMGRYYRGKLTRGVRAQMQEHLDTCELCRECYSQLVDVYGRRRIEHDDRG